MRNTRDLGTTLASLSGWRGRDAVAIVGSPPLMHRSDHSFIDRQECFRYQCRGEHDIIDIFGALATAHQASVRAVARRSQSGLPGIDIGPLFHVPDQ